MMVEVKKEREKFQPTLVEKLPEYPSIEPLGKYLLLVAHSSMVVKEGQETQTGPELSLSADKQREWRIGDLRFEYFAEAQKMVVTDAKGATAFVKPKDGSCTGDDIEIARHATNVGVFEAARWKLTIDISDPKCIRLHTPIEDLDIET